MFSPIRQVFLKTKIPSGAVSVVRFQNISNISDANIVRSKIPDIDIPEVPLHEYVWKGLDKWHNKTAIVCAETGRSYLYSEMYKKSRALASFLHSFDGLKKGDTVAIVLPNVPEYPIIILGAIQAGLKVTPVNPIYTTDEIATQLLNSETKLIFTLTELWPSIARAATKASPSKKIPIATIIHQKNLPAPSTAIRFEEITERDCKANFRISQSFDDVIILPYSSGTTGLPKGVQLTMKNIVSNLHQIDTPQFKIHQDAEGSFQDVSPAVLPMFHIFGMVTNTLNLLSHGCKLITVPKFGSKIFENVLKQHRPTFGFLVPPIVLMLINNPNIRPEHISQLRTVVCGAAPLGAGDIERLHEKSYGKVTLLQGYGLTETSPSTHQQTAILENGIKFGGCGFPLANTECKIVPVDGEDKTPFGSNQPGELYIRGPQIMKGYHNNAKATQEVLDSEGWFKTGDIGYFDTDGHFFITDRLKELIKVKGFQVAPAELEALLRDHPEIEDAAVVGIPHNDFGEVPKAFIVPREGVKINSPKIHEYVANKVAKYKQLAGGIVTVESIPKSPAGKILRRQLKKMEAN